LKRLVCHAFFLSDIQRQRSESWRKKKSKKQKKSKSGILRAPLEVRMPKVDVIDREDELVVCAEYPVSKKDDLDVSVTNNEITIKGHTKQEEKEEKGEYYRCEITRRAFARAIPLPNDVDREKTGTQFKDGVLELTLTKIAKAKRRTVKIN
jgi:HSP20 family protein